MIDGKDTLTKERRPFQKLPWKYFRKLALAQIITATLIILATAGVARYYLKIYVKNQAIEQLSNSLNLIKQSFYYSHLDPAIWCGELSAPNGNRVTIIDLSGKVVCDNKIKLETLDNHKDRPEVQKAIKDTFGTSIRYSDSMRSELIYGAIRLINSEQKEFILRLSFPLTKLSDALFQMDKTIILFLLPLLIATSLLGLYASLKASTPLRALLSKIANADTQITDQNKEYQDEWELLEKSIDMAQGDRNKLSYKLNREYTIKTSLLESISESILAVKTDGRILFANKNFIKNFLPIEKLDMGPDSIRKGILSDYFKQNEIEKMLRESQENQSTLHLNSLKLNIKGNKHEAYFDITTSPITLSKDNIYGVVCVFREVTERILTEQMRETFVANVSHEVRTPLTAMKGYVQTLKQFGLKNEDLAIECMNKIEHNSDRLTHLFSDILNLSVIESRGKITKEDIPLEEITDNVICNVRQSFREKDIKVQTHIEARSLHANGALVEQVLTNLLENAYKYIPKSGEISVIWSEVKSTNQNGVTLIVSDNGPGIEEKHLSRLFERFYRIDESRNSQSGGTGLGLSIVKHIMAKHKGTINVESTLGSGTKFIAYFPQKLR